MAHLLALADYIQATENPAVNAPPIGVYSNGADNLNGKALILTQAGKGIFYTGLSGVPVLWKYDSDKKEVFINGPTGAVPHQTIPSFALLFDPAERTLTILDPKIAGGSRPLHHTKETVPPAILEGLKNFDGTASSIWPRPPGTKSGKKAPNRGHFKRPSAALVSLLGSKFS